MRIASVVGTRPQLIKEAALQPALRARHDEIFIDTGQHYDAILAGDFFDELGLAAPDYSLGIGGGGHASQVGRMLVALEPILLSERPDAVLVYGDTNSTLAGALAGAKLGLPIAHVEAGLRSFDRRMPEEVNRVVVDHLAQWCFAPTGSAVANLTAEGIRSGVLEVGDVMQDLAAAQAPQVQDSAFLEAVSVRLAEGAPGLSLHPGEYLFATIHRAENRGAEALAALSRLLEHVARPERPVVLALHPGTAAAMADHGVEPRRHVVVIPPVGYRTSLALQLHAAAVLTDSGGVQREAAWLSTPCLVLRGTTEWLETLDAPRSSSVVVGLDADRAEQELARLAPPWDSARLARGRALTLDLRPAGAADAVAVALDSSR